MKNIFLLIALLSTILIGCKEEKKTEVASPVENTQMKEVMAIHDEVMPKMSQVSRLASKLKPMVDSTAQGMQYEIAMKDLQAANESMMKWMQDFGKQFDSEEIMDGKELSEQKIILLDVEEKNIKAVKNNIETSISNAKALLADH